MLAVVALAFTMRAAGPAGADGSAEPPGEHDRVVKIGPQAVVIVNERGRVRMYDDPSQQDHPCKSNAACFGKALGIIAGLSFVAYDRSTDVVYVNGRAIEPLGL